MSENHWTSEENDNAFDQRCKALLEGRSVQAPAPQEAWFAASPPVRSRQGRWLVIGALVLLGTAYWVSEGSSEASRNDAAGTQTETETLGGDKQGGEPVMTTTLEGLEQEAIDIPDVEPSSQPTSPSGPTEEWGAMEDVILASEEVENPQPESLDEPLNPGLHSGRETFTEQGQAGPVTTEASIEPVSEPTESSAGQVEQPSVETTTEPVPDETSRGQDTNTVPTLTLPISIPTGGGQ